MKGINCYEVSHFCFKSIFVLFSFKSNGSRHRHAWMLVDFYYYRKAAAAAAATKS